MTSNHHAPYVLGYTRATMAGTERKRDCEVERNSKAGPSSDCRLQLACMKSELLVIVDQNATVNALPGLVHTARHTMEVGGARSWLSNMLPKAKSITGVKSYQGSRSRTSGWITSFLWTSKFLHYEFMDL